MHMYDFVCLDSRLLRPPVLLQTKGLPRHGQTATDAAFRLPQYGGHWAFPDNAPIDNATQLARAGQTECVRAGERE